MAAILPTSSKLTNLT